MRSFFHWGGRWMRFFQSEYPKKRDENQQYNWHLFFTAKRSPCGYCRYNDIPWLTPFKIIEQGNKKKHREEKHENVMTKEPGEIHHVRGDGEEQRDDQRLHSRDIPEPVNAVYQWDKQECRTMREAVVQQDLEAPKSENIPAVT